MSAEGQMWWRQSYRNKYNTADQSAVYSFVHAKDSPREQNWRVKNTASVKKWALHTVEYTEFLQLWDYEPQPSMFILH